MHKIALDKARALGHIAALLPGLLRGHTTQNMSGRSSVVEHHLAKVRVVGSNLIARSILSNKNNSTLLRSFKKLFRKLLKISTLTKSTLFEM